MNTQNWIPLMEYSTRHRVSLSTLRRRIKAGEVEAKLVDGKYLLKDGPLAVANSSPETIAPPTSVKSPGTEPAPAPRVRPAQVTVDQEQFWKTTQSLLNEIKKAYALILQGKEEQIQQLQEEVADLKTLVRVLEEDNSRLKQSQPPVMDFDLGLEV